MDTDSKQTRMRVRREFFNDRAEKWLDMWYLDPETGEHTRHDAKFERLFSEVEVPADGCVLDIGSGSGILVPYVLSHLSPAGRLIEVDYAEKMIEENRRLHRDERVSFLVADAMSLDIEPLKADLVLCFSCFPHFEQQDMAVENLARTLNPGGKLAVVHFDSSEDINDLHRKHDAVKQDMLPDEAHMRQYMHQAGLEIEIMLDEPGFYLLLAERRAE